MTWCFSLLCLIRGSSAVLQSAGGRGPSTAVRAVTTSTTDSSGREGMDPVMESNIAQLLAWDKLCPLCSKLKTVLIPLPRSM